LLDFEIAHVDIRAADIAQTRRGWHDPVVAGYLSHTPLSDAELQALDGLWLGGILNGVWRVLENRLAEGSELTYGFNGHVEQLDKTRPYRP
jgi:Ser/Thr protein kinase RdoA (MazF antagonist)